MNTTVRQKSSSPSPLEHSLSPHFSELARFDSTKALEASPLYAPLRAEVCRVLDAVEVGDFAPPTHASADEPPRVVGNLRGRAGEVLSDHDPIVLDFGLGYSSSEASAP